jgi:hypothetical protein
MNVSVAADKSILQHKAASFFSFPQATKSNENKSYIRNLILGFMHKSNPCGVKKSQLFPLL